MQKPGKEVEESRRYSRETLLAAIANYVDAGSMVSGRQVSAPSAPTPSRPGWAP
jgi:hypothetical protein